MSEQSAFDHDVYATYLNAHLLAAEAGLRAFEGATATWEGTPHEETMRALVGHIVADRRDLLELIRGLGYEESPLKQALTHPAAAAGVLNPANLLHRRGTSNTQLELDSLTGMVRAKLSMWEALIALQPHDERLVLAGLLALRHRSQEQIELLQRVSRATVLDRFLEAGAST